MAGHWNLPAKRATGRDDICKSERQQLDPFHNNHIHTARGRRAGFRFMVQPQRARKSKRLVPQRVNGLALDSPTRAVQEG